jgi:hypothetical protein
MTEKSFEHELPREVVAAADAFLVQLGPVGHDDGKDPDHTRFMQSLGRNRRKELIDLIARYTPAKPVRRRPFSIWLR